MTMTIYGSSVHEPVTLRANAMIEVMKTLLMIAVKVGSVKVININLSAKQ